MGMSLDAGGHLTHGFRPNITGKMFHQRSYGTDPRPGCSTTTRWPRPPASSSRWSWSAGYSAYPRRVNFAKMREIADEVGATLMVDMAHFAGLVAGKVFTGDEDPVPHAHVTTTTTHKSLRGPRGGLVLATARVRRRRRQGLPDGARRSAVARDGRQGRRARRGAPAVVPDVRAAGRRQRQGAGRRASCKRGATLVTGGTDNHIVLLDVQSFGLTGRQAESALLDSGVVTNRNSIPADPNGAWYTSGIRFGTPALTTRGFGAAEFDRVAELVVEVLTNTEAAAAASVRRRPSTHWPTAPPSACTRRRRTAGRQPAVPGPDAVTRDTPSPDFRKGVNVGYSYFYGTETCP